MDQITQLEDAKIYSPSKGSIYAEVLAINFIVHRHQLVATNVSPVLYLTTTIKAINQIKSHSKYDHLVIKLNVDKEQ